MFFYKKVTNLRIKKLNLSINFGRDQWKYFKLFSNIFIKNTITKQIIILNFTKIKDYNYSKLSKDLNHNYTEVIYNENIFYHYFINFDKDEILEYEWILIKNSFLITFTTTISSKKNKDEIDMEYENVIDILKQIK
jgi:hypothetical protein